MRNRLAATFCLVILMSLFGPWASAGTSLLAQYESPASEGSEDAPAEEGGEEEATEEEAEEETAATPEAGPPWTYQMARLTVAIVALLTVAIGLAYHRFVVRRQRGEV